MDFRIPLATAYGSVKIQTNPVVHRVYSVSITPGSPGSKL